MTKKDEKINIALKEIQKKYPGATFERASAIKPKERIKFPEYLEEFSKFTGGIPLKAFTIVWGNKSCGKTTLVYTLLSQVQALGKTVVYYDLEGTFDGTWASAMGVNLDELIIGRGQTAENVMDAIRVLAQEKAIDFVVIDSVQAMSPKGEQETKKGKEKSIEDDEMALLARKLSKFFRVTTHGIYEANIGVLLIGQARKDLGSFIVLDTLSGGHALNHFSTMTIKLYRGSKSDAPKYKFKVSGKTKTFNIGFSLNARMEKKKISDCAPENAVLTIPFYEGTAFRKPTEEEIKEIYGEWIEMETEEGEEDNG